MKKGPMGANANPHPMILATNICMCVGNRGIWQKTSVKGGAAKKPPCQKKNNTTCGHANVQQRQSKYPARDKPRECDGF